MAAVAPVLETVEYLRQHSLEELKKEHNISARFHATIPNLVSLKYKSKGGRIVSECRGLILDSKDDWNVVALPFYRFFNYGEPGSAEIDWSTARVMEKMDGSLMILYRYADEWHVASSNSADAGAAFGHDLKGNKITLADLFWEIWRNLGYELPGADYYHHCFMFEIVSPRHLNVTKIKEDGIFALGARNLATLVEADIIPLAKQFGWHVPPVMELRSVEEALQAASALNGALQEGFVVCDAAFNRIKIKSPQYVVLSVMPEEFEANPEAYGGMYGVSDKWVQAMVQVVRSGEQDEFLTYFPRCTDLYNAVGKQYEAVCDSVKAAYDAHIAGAVEGKDAAAAAAEPKPAAAAEDASDEEKEEEARRAIVARMVEQGIDNPKQYFAGLTYLNSDDLYVLMRCRRPRDEKHDADVAKKFGGKPWKQPPAPKKEAKPAGKQKVCVVCGEVMASGNAMQAHMKKTGHVRA